MTIQIGIDIGILLAHRVHRGEEPDGGIILACTIVVEVETSLAVQFLPGVPVRLDARAPRHVTHEGTVGIVVGDLTNPTRLDDGGADAAQMVTDIEIGGYTPRP